MICESQAHRSAGLENNHVATVSSSYVWNKFVLNIYWSGKQESRPPCFEVWNGLRQAAAPCRVIDGMWRANYSLGQYSCQILQWNHVTRFSLVHWRDKCEARANIFASSIRTNFIAWITMIKEDSSHVEAKEPLAKNIVMQIKHKPTFPFWYHGTKTLFFDHNHHHHHRMSVMELGHLLTRSGLTYPEVSSKVWHDSFCQLGNSVLLPWVIYYEAFYLHVVSCFSSIPVICLKSVPFLIPLQFVYLFCNLSKCILLFFSCISSPLLLFFWRPLL